MTLRHERSESGDGRLEADGQQPLPIHYRIDIARRMLDAGHGEQVAGLRSITGQLAGVNSWDIIPYVGAVVLVLEDGRRWECNLVNNAGRLSNRSSDPPFA